MYNNGFTSFYLIIISVIAGILFTILPFSRLISAVMPQWMLLITLFWVTNKNQSFGVGFAFLMGILADCMAGTAFGIHAFGFVFVTYFVLKIRVSVQFLPMWQQISGIAILTFLYLLTKFVVGSFYGYSIFIASLWFSVITSALVWPIISLMLGSSQGELKYAR